jgi:hypothetical protein
MLTACTIIFGRVSEAGGFNQSPVGSSIEADDHGSFSEAIDAIGTNRTALVIGRRFVIDASKQVPSNVGLIFLNGGELNMTPGAVVAIDGSIDAGLYRIFSGKGAVMFGAGSVKEVHPEWWGAMADNSTDSGEPIQKSIDASPEGSVIRFGGGTYLTSAPIVFRPDRAYVGSSHSGNGTVIKQKDNSSIAPAIFVSSGWMNNGMFADNRVIFRDFLIHGNKANNGGAITHGILSMNYYSVIENITVFGITGDGIRFTDQNSEGITIKGTAVGNKVIHSKFIKCDGSGIRGDDHGSILTDGYIVDNEVGNCGEYGIYIGRGAGWKVLGNYVYGAGFDGITLGRAWNSQILGNTIDNFGTSLAPGTYTGITMGSISDNVPCLVNDNIINLPKAIDRKLYRGIHVSAAQEATAAEAIVADNIARFPGAGKFLVAGGNGGGTVHVAGNRVSGTSTAIDRQSGAMKIIHDGNSFDMTFAPFADGDTTPSVLEGSHFRAANKRSTVITNFDDGYEGQRITVVFDTANTRVDFTKTAFKGNGGVDWPAKAGDYMECVFDGNFWYCTTSRNMN